MENIAYDRKSKILIIDDDKSVRDFLKIFLTKKGYADVQSVEGGRRGIEIAQKDNIRLVLLDIKLPDMDGLEVLREIKKIKTDAAVIMITGYPEEEKAKEMLKAGAYDYIVKPFDLEYLELSVLTKFILMDKQ